MNSSTGVFAPASRATRGLVVAVAVALCAWLAFLVGPSAFATGTTTAPFTECPHIGADTSCGILIVINANGSPTVLGDPSQGPYDGVEDTLIGVLNNSGQTITAMPVSGSGDIFGFDSDGICDPNNSNVPFSPGADCSGNPSASTGYEGPDIFFTNYGGSSGTVNFENGGLAPGASTYFSLEGQVTASSLVIYPLIQVSSTAVAATEGAGFAGAVASFTDADTTAPASQFSASINWGDGNTTAGTITGSGGSYTVTGSHTYAEEGTYTAKVTVNDAHNPTNPQTVTDQVSVADASLAATGATAFTSPSTVSHTVATFTDADPNGVVGDYTASINWGDGTAPSAGTITASGTGFAVSGTHSYAALGPDTITVHICDVGGACADATTSVIVYANASGGSFVLGSGAPTTGAVTYWSSQWTANNDPAAGVHAFKGFETSDPAPACGDTWTSGTGNSVNPPATVPSYMAVVVTNTVSQSGSTVSGNVTKVVVVKTDPGYGPNPGQAGTGTIVATVCG